MSRAVVFGAAAVLLAGCMSDVPDESLHMPGARRTGEYPNLNIRPRSAATQFSRGEANAGRAGLESRKDAVEQRGALPRDSQRDRLQVLAGRPTAQTRETTGSLDTAGGAREPAPVDAGDGALISRDSELVRQQGAAGHESQRSRLQELAVSHRARTIEAIEKPAEAQ